MSDTQRTIDSVYDEIAGLSGNRAELERERYQIVKAIRSLKAIQQDSATMSCLTDDDEKALSSAIERLEAVKSAIWVVIERTDGGISRLTDLVQNGAFNA